MLGGTYALAATADVGPGRSLTASLCSSACPNLEASIWLLCTNAPIFRREWAYLHRNLSGKYRVMKLSESAADFEYLKTSSAVSADHVNLADGRLVLLRYLQPLAAPDALHTVRANVPPGVIDQLRDASVAEPAILRSQRHDGPRRGPALLEAGDRDRERSRTRSCGR